MIFMMPFIFGVSKASRQPDYLQWSQFTDFVCIKRSQDIVTDPFVKG